MTSDKINILSNILVKRANDDDDDDDDDEEEKDPKSEQQQPTKRLRRYIENELYNPTTTPTTTPVQLKSQIPQNEEVLSKAANEFVKHVHRFIQTILCQDEILKIIKPLVENVIEMRKTSRPTSSSSSTNQTSLNDESVVDAAAAAAADDQIESPTIFDTAFRLQEKLSRPPVRNSSSVVVDERRAENQTLEKIGRLEEKLRQQQELGRVMLDRLKLKRKIESWKYENFIRELSVDFIQSQGKSYSNVLHNKLVQLNDSDINEIVAKLPYMVKRHVYARKKYLSEHNTLDDL